MGAIASRITHQLGDRNYLLMAQGRCAALHISDEGRTICALYSRRPDVCRALQPGSEQCLECREANRGRLPEVEARRASIRE